MGFFRKAFTLVELLIAIVLFTILGSIIFYVIIKSLRTTSTEGGELKAETSIELNTDILDFDIRHVGYGISKDETSLVLSYCNGTGAGEACTLANILNTDGKKLLLLKETSEYSDYCSDSNPVNPTIGFAICNGTTDIVDEIKKISDNYRLIAVNLNKTLINDQVNVNISSCGDFRCSELNPYISGINIYFPYNKDKACKSSYLAGCCKQQYCTAIAWYARTPNDTDSASFPKACRLMGTKIFYRNVINSSGRFYNFQPAINCVSDWDVWFGLDTDGDGQIDKWVNEIPNTDIASNADLANKLKAIKVYLLVQASYQLDKNYDYCKLSNVECDDHSSCGDDGYIKVDELNGKPVCLKHPSNPNWVHYRWKTVELIYTSLPNLETFKNP